MEALNTSSGLLLSGGMDSTALAWWMRPAWAITIDYGQRPADAEVRAAEHVCRELDICHHVLRIDCSALGSGDMANAPNLDVAPTPEWWPFRNQTLVTFAAAYLLRFGVRRILIGTLRTDNTNRDGSKAFISALDRLLSLQEGEMKLEAPAIEHDPVSLIRTSGVAKGLLAVAHSCHIANHACGRCRGCAKRAATWAEIT